MDERVSWRGKRERVEVRMSGSGGKLDELTERKIESKEKSERK